MVVRTTEAGKRKGRRSRQAEAAPTAREAPLLTGAPQH
jgi:hypothetical protein